MLTVAIGRKRGTERSDPEEKEVNGLRAEGVEAGDSGLDSGVESLSRFAPPGDEFCATGNNE